MSADSALSRAFSGSRRHFSTPTRRGLAANLNGVSQTPANSEIDHAAVREEGDDLGRVAADELKRAVRVSLLIDGPRQLRPEKRNQLLEAFRNIHAR